MSVDWKSIYHGQVEWIPKRTIFLTKHGSHAYGTNLPTSDLDIRGVCIAPKRYYLGFLEGFEQVVQQDQEPDLTIFEVRKFIDLAADGNPSILEILFTDPSDHLLVTEPMKLLLAEKDLFLTTAVKHRFSGYALSQLQRINLHYRWLNNPPERAPTRGEFDLPERTLVPADQLAAAESAIKKQMDYWSWHDMEDLKPSQRQALKDEFFRRLLEITQWSWAKVDDGVWKAAAQTLGFDTNFIHLLDRERQFKAKAREWAQYNEWKVKRNPDRAKLEEQFGYDTKHGMHLVRLLRMCREILTTGKVLVRRPDADELLEIRRGGWDYHTLVSWAQQQDKELTELMKTSKLPHKPNRVRMNELCIQMVELMGLP